MLRTLSAIVRLQEVQKNDSRWIRSDPPVKLPKKFAERYPEDPSEDNFYRFLNKIATEDIACFATNVKKKTRNKHIGILTTIFLNFRHSSLPSGSGSGGSICGAV